MAALPFITAALKVPYTNSDCAKIFATGLGGTGGDATLVTTVFTDTLTAGVDGVNLYKKIGDVIKTTTPDACTSDRVISLMGISLYHDVANVMGKVNQAAGFAAGTQTTLVTGSSTGLSTGKITAATGGLIATADTIFVAMNNAQKYYTKYLTGLSAQINFDSGYSLTLDGYLNKYITTSTSGSSNLDADITTTGFLTQGTSTTVTINNPSLSTPPLAAYYTKAKTDSIPVFESYAPVLTVWYLNKLLDTAPSDYDITIIRDKIASKKDAFAAHLDTLLKQIKFTTTASTAASPLTSSSADTILGLTIPFDISSGIKEYPAFSASHYSKFATEVTYRTIIAYSMATAKEMLFEFNNVILPPIPATADLNKEIVYPDKIFKDLPAKEAVKAKTVVVEKKKKEDNTLLLIGGIFMIAIIVAFIFWYFYK